MLISGAQQAFDGWFESFKADFKSKNQKFKEELAAAEDELDTDAMDRIEEEQKVFRASVKSNKIEKQASRDEAIATINANSERKAKAAVNTVEVAAHKAKLKSKEEEIVELTARVLELDRQSLRDAHRRKLTGVVSVLKECFEDLRAFQDRAVDDADSLMDADTLMQLEKYTASTALQLTLNAVRQYPILREKLAPAEAKPKPKPKPKAKAKAKAKARVVPMETVDLVGSDDEVEDEEEMEERDVVGKQHTLQYKSKLKLKLKRRAASDGAAAATLAASPYSNHSSASSSAKRHKGGRKQPAFSCSSSSASSAAAAASSDRPRA